MGMIMLWWRDPDLAPGKLGKPRGYALAASLTLSTLELIVRYVVSQGA